MTPPMLNSRDIDRLRPDIAANCRAFIELMRLAGYAVLVTGTVRDNAYQLLCYRNGKSRAKTPSYHGEKAGLAFDICQNIKGREYNDAGFWNMAGAVGKKMGFTWGGDWTSIVDKPHFQWDAHGAFTGGMVRRGTYPPTMPRYDEEEDDMAKLTYEEFADYMKRYLSIAGTGDAPSSWAVSATEAAKADGIINGDGKGNYGWQKPITREAVAVILNNILERGGGLSG